MPNPQNPSPPGYLDRTLAALADAAAQTPPIIEHPGAPSAPAPLPVEPPPRVFTTQAQGSPTRPILDTLSGDSTEAFFPSDSAAALPLRTLPEADSFEALDRRIAGRYVAPSLGPDAWRSLFDGVRTLPLCPHPPAPADAAGVFSALLSLVSAHYAKYHLGDVSPVTPTATWAELGFDSLDRIDIAMAIEDAWGVELPDDVVETVHTVTQAAVWLVAHLAEGADHG